MFLEYFTQEKAAKCIVSGFVFKSISYQIPTSESHKEKLVKTLSYLSTYRGDSEYSERAFGEGTVEVVERRAMPIITTSLSPHH